MITFTFVLITMWGGEFHETRVQHIPTLEACQVIQGYYKKHYSIDEVGDRNSAVCFPVEEIPALNIREIK